MNDNHSSHHQVDLAAFSDPIKHDIHTSCIAAQRLDPSDDATDIVASFSYLATPVALTLQSEGADVWSVRSSSPPEHLRHLSYDSLTQYFTDHEQDFRPITLNAAKVRNQQLSFFDLDRSLLQFAYDTTQSILVARFETAVGTAKDLLAKTPDTQDHHLTKLALQLLAAAILDDKQMLGSTHSEKALELLQRSESAYSQYFDATVAKSIGADISQALLDALRNNVTFRSFSNEMLGHFYENALVDQVLRRDLGVYYTPQAIARRMLARLPIEDLPPTERTIFDGSSGSGNLLLAGYERLQDLLPGAWSRERKHQYLVRRLHGVDLDQFAAQVAGLSLFFMSLPAGDAWNVKPADFLSNDGPLLPSAPTVMVGNPPFAGSRSIDGKRHEKASTFLMRYLDLLRPGGLLGVILPESFLETTSCRDARKRLLRECDLLEIWHLPEGIFPMSQVATVVLLAKKRGKTDTSANSPIQVERVSSVVAEKEAYLAGGRPRFSYVIDSTALWLNDPDSRMLTSMLENTVWGSLQFSRRLNDIASIRNGIIPGSRQRASHLSTQRRGSEWKPWLAGVRDIDPYLVSPSTNHYVSYPGDLQWPRLDLEPVFSSPWSKVLLNSGRAPNNPWRLLAAIDTIGVFPSQSFHCLIPKSDSVRLEELVAVLNSSYANAWMDSRNRKRWLSESTLREMPMPTFTGSTQTELVDRVTDIMRLKEANQDHTHRTSAQATTLRQHILAIDDLVCDALEIDEDGRQVFEQIFAGHRRPGSEWPKPHTSSTIPTEVFTDRQWPITGEIMHVDAESSEATLWVRGFNADQPFQIPIPESLPGWALRPDTAFQAEVPRRAKEINSLFATDISDVRLLDFSFSKPEDLVQLLQHPDRLNSYYDS
ncbi:MAG: N-6 DNA methylase [Bryobacterales bacterium]|nr:N-6 DNA methylase [Bryobacterales bacterium]